MEWHMASVDFLSILFLVVEPQLQTQGEKMPRDCSGDDQQNCRIPVRSNLTRATGSPSPGLYQRQLTLLGYCWHPSTQLWRENEACRSFCPTWSSVSPWSVVGLDTWSWRWQRIAGSSVGNLRLPWIFWPALLPLTALPQEFRGELNVHSKAHLIVPPVVVFHVA